MCKYLVLFLAPAVLAQSISPSGGSGSSGNSTGISAQKASTTSFTVTSSSAAGFGDTRYSIPASSTCTVTASAVDAIYVYVNASGNLVNATASATVSCSPSATSVTASAFPADVVQIATIAVLANGTLGTLTPLYVGGVAKTVTCSSGCTVTETSTGIGISTTAITGGTCTNQATTAISTTGVPTCTTLSSAYVDSSIQPSATAVTLTGAQTLTNKTLTAPELTSPTVGGNLFTLSAPLTTTGTGALTLTNPTGAAQTITMPNAASVTLARTDAGQTFTGVQTFSTAPVLSSLSANVLLLVNGSNVINSTGPTFNPANSIGTWGNLTLQGNAGQIQGSGAGWQIGGVAIGPSNTSPGTGTASFLDRTATTGATAVCIGCDFASHTSATTTQLTIQDGAGQSTTAQLQGKNSSGAVTWSITGGGQINSGNIINTGGGGYAGNYYQDQLFLKGYFSTAAANVNWQNINRITTNVNMQIQGIASQTADLLQFTNASAPSTILAKFDSGGNFVETGTITYNGNSPPTNSVVCYKAGGVLGYATNTSGVIGTTCN